jgi:hypothetical protein
MKKILIAAAAVALLAACDAGESALERKLEPTQVQKKVSVPVCHYTVPRGDKLERIFESEMGKGFYKIEGFTPHDRFIMGAGRAGNQRVQFTFNQYEVMRLINGTQTGRFWYDSELVRGEKILVPDLNNNGMIRFQPCNAVGTLTLAATYNRQSGAVTKTLGYEGKTVNVE